MKTDGGASADLGLNGVCSEDSSTFTLLESFTVISYVPLLSFLWQSLDCPLASETLQHPRERELRSQDL